MGKDLRARVKGWLEQPYRRSAEPLASTMLVRDLLAEVERLTTAILRAHERAGIDGSNYDETLNDVDKILGTAILGGQAP